MDTPYHALGGMDTCRGLAAALYARVEHDPVLRPLFPSTFRCAIEGRTLFLAEFLGGPGALRQFFEEASAHLIGQLEESNGRKQLRPTPIHGEIASRWDAQRTLEEAAAAVRRGDAPRGSR